MDSDIHQSYSKHFNENYKLSKKLIDRLVEKSITSSFDEEFNKEKIKLPHPVVQEIKQQKVKKLLSKPSSLSRQPTQVSEVDKLVHSPRLPLDYLQPSMDESILKLQWTDDDDEESNESQCPVHYNGTELLPEYKHLKAKAIECKGSIDLSHLNFGNHRIAILTEKLTPSENEMLSLCLRDNRLTDAGICELVRNLESSSHKSLTSLDLSYNKMGRKGAKALASYVHGLKSLMRLNISSMGMGDGNIRVFFNTLTKHAVDGHMGLDEINDINGSIGSVEDSSLVDTMTRLDDSDIELDLPALRSLRLSHNKVEATGARALARFLKTSGSGLAELDISWNEMRSEGAKYIWEALEHHDSLTSLDISWNSLGSGTTKVPVHTASSPTKITVQEEGSLLNGRNFQIGTSNGSKDFSAATSLKDILQANQTLLHLNISHNSFSADECAVIGEGLSMNHTLLGLHITGNSGRIDNYGSLAPDPEPWPLQAAHKSEQIIKDLEIRKHIPPTHSAKLCQDSVSRNCCWICESWQEVEFAYQLSEEDMVMLKRVLEDGERSVHVSKLAREKEKISRAFPVHLFTSFDQWKPERMLLREPKERDEEDNDKLHCTLKRATTEVRNVEPRKPLMPAPTAISRRPSFRRQNSSKKSENPRMSAYNKPIIRRRVSGDIPEDKPKTPPPTMPGRKAPPMIQTALSQSFAYDSSDDEDEDCDRRRGFENAKYMLQSFESGHWSMMGGFHYDDESGSEEDEFAASLLQHPSTGMMQALTPGRGVLVQGRDARKFSFQPREDIGIIDEKSDRPVYSLRRMVPPGRHAYVFAVGFPPESADKPFLVHDPLQPHNRTTAALSAEVIELARLSGALLPPIVNTIFMFPNQSLEQARRNLCIPEALTLAKSLSYSRSAKPRVVNTATLTARQKVWHKSDGILYKQYIMHDKKHQGENFHTDWRYCKSARIFSKDQQELKSIRDSIWEAYSLIMEVFTYYSAVYPIDANGLGGMAFNEIVLHCYILDPVYNIYSETENVNTEGQFVPLFSTPTSKGENSKPEFPTSPRSQPEEHANDSTHTQPNSPKKLEMKSGQDKVVASNPRGTKLMCSPRASFLLKQLSSLHISNSETESFMDRIEEESEGESEMDVPQISLDGDKLSKRLKARAPRVTDGAVSRADVDMIFIANCITGPKVEANSKRTLTRFQFLDVIIALACVKFVQSNISPTVAEAIAKFSREVLGQYAHRERDDIFMNSIMGTKIIDDAVRAHWKDIEKIFRCFSSGVESATITQKVFPLSSWLYLTQQPGIELGERAARVAFAYSKTMYAMDVLDAKYDAKNFAEALVRCAFSKRRDILENEPDDAGGGLSPTAVAEQLVEIIKSMKAVVSAKK